MFEHADLRSGRRPLINGAGGAVGGYAVQLADLVALIDAGELHVDVVERLPLSELAAVPARSDAGAVPGKVVPLPGAA